jgi:hypothetical protein
MLVRCSCNKRRAEVLSDGKGVKTDKVDELNRDESDGLLCAKSGSWSARDSLKVEDPF